MKFYNHFYSAFLLLSLVACGQQETKKKNDRKTEQAEAKQELKSYDFSKPEVYKMPKVLNEISGLFLYNGSADNVYAEQDEEGKLFHFKLGSEEVTETKFGRKGDYEDVQFFGDQVVMLRSDGTLFVFPFSEAKGEKATSVKEYDDLLANGEFEGMYADNKAKKLYVLCKHCNENLHKTTTGYIIEMDKDGSLKPAGNFTINVEDIEQKAGAKKIDFKPSALAKNEQTNEWFIVSSVNKMLVIANSDWSIKEVLMLDDTLFNQPEGIAFDTENNLYISNEKGTTASATILKFAYQKK